MFNLLCVGKYEFFILDCASGAEVDTIPKRAFLKQGIHKSSDQLYGARR